MNKKIILIIIILAVVLALLLYLYYTNKSSLLTLNPKVQETGNQQQENLPFDTKDNLDQAIEDLNYIE